MKFKLFMLMTLSVAILGIVVCSRLPIEHSNTQNHRRWVLLTEAPPVAAHAGPFFSVLFFHTSLGLAIGPISIEKTDDGGSNWTTVKGWDERSQGFSSMISANGQLWIVGSERNAPLILTTKTKGLNRTDWEKMTFGGKASDLRAQFKTLNEMCFDPSGDAWAVGDGGVVQLRISDESMQVVNVIGSKNQLHSISCDPSGHVWVTGENDTLLHYRGSWKTIETGKLATFFRIVAYERETWLLGAENSSNEKTLRKGLLLRSRNKGETWENVTPESADVLRDVLVRGETGWLVGDRGSIYSSKDGGASWNKEISPTTNNLLNLFFLDSHNIWIAGDRVSILRYQNSAVP